MLSRTACAQTEYMHIPAVHLGLSYSSQAKCLLSGEVVKVLDCSPRFYPYQLGNSFFFSSGYTSGVPRILKSSWNRNCMLPKAAHRKFSPSFFRYQDGLLSHCKQSLLSKVSWRALLFAELAVFMLTLLHAPSTKLVIKVPHVRLNF